ncbi:MAG: type IX secretion system membrane protein PorP/SprF [Bacteroidetes bacterium]|nr:type IX secretion system membrane protein PorP/SprF [Bacteroidota bacterium]
MKMKSIHILFLIVISVSGAAQQIPVFTMQELVQPGLNPAYTGIDGIFDVVMLTRQQWVGFEGAPESYYLAANAPLRSQTAGVGFSFQRQRSGPLTQNGLFLSYSYSIEISEKSELSFGIRGGINNYQIILSDLTVIDPGDPFFESSVNNLILPNFGTGLHYTIGNYFIDVSLPILLRNEYNSNKNQTVGMLNREDRTFNTQTGAVLDISEGITLHPTLEVRWMKDTPPLIDIRLYTELRESIGFGLVYRVSGSFGAYIIYRAFENFIFGYAYELPVGYDYHLTSGTHEVVLGFDFEFLKSKTQSPRRF